MHDDGVFGQRASIAPEQAAGPGIDGNHLVAGRRDEHHAAVDERRGLVAVHGAGRKDPCRLQPCDVGGVDLIERAVAPPIVGAADHQPFVIRGLEELGRGHGRIGLQNRRHWQRRRRRRRGDAGRCPALSRTNASTTATVVASESVFTRIAPPACCPLSAVRLRLSSSAFVSLRLPSAVCRAGCRLPAAGCRFLPSAFCLLPLSLLSLLEPGPRGERSGHDQPPIEDAERQRRQVAWRRTIRNAPDQGDRTSIDGSRNRGPALRRANAPDLASRCECRRRIGDHAIGGRAHGCARPVSAGSRRTSTRRLRRDAIAHDATLRRHRPGHRRGCAGRDVTGRQRRGGGVADLHQQVAGDGS